VVYNAKTKRQLSGSKRGESFCLYTIDGKRKTVAARKLVQMVYGKLLIQDNVDRLPEEEFQEISGSEGRYLISTAGRLLSYQRKAAAIMKPARNTTDNGYYRTMITLNGKP